MACNAFFHDHRQSPDASTVINYTVLIPTKTNTFEKGANGNNSISRQVQVESGTNVTFLCEGEGNPLPRVEVKIQNSSTPIPSELFPLGSYIIKAVASKTVECRDTAYYDCNAFNWIGGTDTETILVTVLCKYLSNGACKIATRLPHRTPNNNTSLRQLKNHF